MYKSRTIEDTLLKTSNTFPVVLITGPRQVGKTTVFQNCEREKRSYVSLDELVNRELAKKDPKLFLEKYKTPVLIDEIQYAPELLPYIKLIVDTKKQNGMYWITGSQQFDLMKNVSESLAGRVGILKLQGFSQKEKFDKSLQNQFLPTKEFLENKSNKLKKIDINKLYNIIWLGSFPKLNINKNVDWTIFYSSYVQTYIERDIRDLINISNEDLFLRFLRVLSTRTGQELNYASISNDVGTSQPTIKSWVSLLKTTGLIYLLEPYYNNITNRIIKTPKLYFLDTGLVCYLSGWQNSNTLELSAMSGAIFETYVVSEILKSYWHNGKIPNIYFYRDKEQKEIDLIIEENGTLYPIEIKKKTNADKEDIKHFKVLEQFKKPIGDGAVICMSDDWLPITKNVNMIPFEMI